MTDTKAVTITRHLPVKLDQYRERQLHTQQTDATMEELRLTEHLKNVSDSLKTKIKDEVKKRTDAARALHAGFEHKSVECAERVELERNAMVLFRVDTCETVEERALTADEIKYHTAKQKGAL